MITLKSPRQIEEMKQAGRMVADCHKEIAAMIRPGITTLEINDYVERRLAEMGGSQFTKGYNGYEYAICASVNDVIAHGFPDKKNRCGAAILSKLILLPLLTAGLAIPAGVTP